MQNIRFLNVIISLVFIFFCFAKEESTFPVYHAELLNSTHVIVRVDRKYHTKTHLTSKMDLFSSSPLLSIEPQLSDVLMNNKTFFNKTKKSFRRNDDGDDDVDEWLYINVYNACVLQVDKNLILRCIVESASNSESKTPQESLQNTLHEGIYTVESFQNSFFSLVNDLRFE